MSTWTPKPVGGERRFPRPRLDAVDRNIIACRHFPPKATPTLCNFCGQVWPCDAYQLLLDLEMTEAAFRRNVTMPF